jgi:ferric-dicitrate binding protein FerR (iron transport regulator)
LGVLGFRQVSKAANDVPPGQRQAQQRETVRIAERAVLVLEAGTAVLWRALGDTVVVEQGSGEAFYRVDQGPLHVRTPFGVVRASGTCFQVAVKGAGDRNEDLSVTVYEGRVALSRGSSEVDLQPGDRGLVSGGGTPMRLWRGQPPIEPTPTPAPTAADDP